MSYSIQFDVSLPASRALNTTSTYPWDSMPPPSTDVTGQTKYASFFVPMSNLPSAEFRPSPPERLKRTGFKAETRKLVENGVTGIRVFRTA